MENEGEVIEDPIELIGKPYHFKVVIHKAHFDQKIWRDIYCEYNIIKEDGNISTFKTKTV